MIVSVTSEDSFVAAYDVNDGHCVAHLARGNSIRGTPMVYEGKRAELIACHEIHPRLRPMTGKGWG